MLSAFELHERYRYHPPSKEAQRLHQHYRDLLEGVAAWAETNLPEGREKSLVQTKFEEALFWGNASIARNLSKADQKETNENQTQIKGESK